MLSPAFFATPDNNTDMMNNNNNAIETTAPAAAAAPAPKTNNKNNNNAQKCVLASSSITDPDVLQAYYDALEDVHTRFLLNLPPEELATADRILFQIEQAWWFYEDWICDAASNNNNDSNDNNNTNDDASSNKKSQLPRFKHLKAFATEMFHFSPLLDTNQFSGMWEQFSKYKRKISTFGCILLNDTCTHAVLCQEWNTRSWTFPSGKINQNEQGIIAAGRETYEETGFDVTGQMGAARDLLSENNTLWKPLNESDVLHYVEDSGKRRTCYLCVGVPENFPFEPVARKEIASIQWHPIDNIPKKSHAVIPFVSQLKRWIKKKKIQNKRDKSREKSNQRDHQRAKSREKSNQQQRDKSNQRGGGDNKRATTPSNNNKKKRDKTPNKDNTTSSSSSRKNTPNRKNRIVMDENDPLLESGLVSNLGDTNRWSEEDMFKANEKLMGRKVEYDGNPHIFTDEGFAGKDPHAFHVVGGTFMNSDAANITTGDGIGGIIKLAPPPPTSKLQTLFNSTEGKGDDELELTPFFNDGGVTPWGEVCLEAAADTSSNDNASNANTPKRQRQKQKKQQQKNKNNNNNSNDNAAATTANDVIFTSNESGEALLELLRGGGSGGGGSGGITQPPNDELDNIFMTDAEITQKSQISKLTAMQISNTAKCQPLMEKYKQQLQDAQKQVEEQKVRLEQQYQQDMEYMQNWVQNSLPPSKPTKHFGEPFKFQNVDAMIDNILNVST